MDPQRNRAERLHELVLDWFGRAERDLPWRGDVSPWAVMVSEFMLQQTPVARVLPVFAVWMERWPTPASLAGEPAGSAVRAWGRLGYPRRALRLHAAARMIANDHDGEVPRSLDALRMLPGVGEYTSAAIASFAFSQSHVVADTNVRRVLARLENGCEFPAGSFTAAERHTAERLMPETGGARWSAARWSAAVMELGALVCTARAPDCAACPVRDECAWRAAGYPAHAGPVRRAQSYEGTDRQCRGDLLGVLRSSVGPVIRAELDAAWPDDSQRERALDGLLADGLVEEVAGSHLALPGTTLR